MTDAQGRLDHGHLVSAAARLSMMYHRGSVNWAEYTRARRRIDAGLRAYHAGRAMPTRMAAEEGHMARARETRALARAHEARAMARYEENPGELAAAFFANLLFAGGGAVIGGIVNPPFGSGALNGAGLGFALTGIGGLAWGLIAPGSRDFMFPVAGVGLAGLLILQITTTLVATLSKPSTTTATT
jgi:hypothetical protein